MTERGDIVRLALSYNGYLNGAGYDGPNQFSAALGHPPEAWCGDFVSNVFRVAGLPLPSMQDGIATGFSYCPSALAYAHEHNAVITSWESQPGDIFLFDWNGNGEPDHTELGTGYVNPGAYTIGGNSGPSNVDGYTGTGGVHRHVWNAPVGQGNNLILAVIDASKLVKFGNPVPPPPSKAPRWPGRNLMLKTPELVGNDVHMWQNQLASRHWNIRVDGVYGPASKEICVEFQKQKGLVPDGIVGEITWNASWNAPVTTT
jgi:peptidoglycan hydrolase-like protein with peptidoglycan-binding domain